MSDAQKRIKLFTWRQGVLMAFAAAGGLGINAYRTWRTAGGHDATWFAIAGFTLAAFGAICWLIARHANRPERED